MQEPGPFERVLQPDPSPSRDRAATIIVAAGIVLGLFMLLLVLPPISILDNGGDEGGAVEGTVSATARDEMPPVPSGYEAVSALYDLETTEPVDRAATVGVPLTTTQPLSAELFLFTYQDDSWEQVGTATVVAEGNAASGEVDPLPSNVAVFRTGSAAHAVSGSLPTGAEVDPGVLTSLTTLNPQGYTVGSDGGIVGTPPDLTSDLQAAIVPTIRAEDAAALGTILSTGESRAGHITAIMTLVNDNSYAGVDLDYRVLDPQNGGDYTEFVATLSDELHQANRTLTMSLPAPVQEDGEWNTHGFSWEDLGARADVLKIVASSEPGTAYTQLDDAAAYLVPRVGANKLFITVNTLSREQSPEGLRTLSLSEALTLASTPAIQGDIPVAAGASTTAYAQNLSEQSGGTPMLWDDSAKAVTFTYTGGGGVRSVWLANSFSESAKLDIVERYQLGGVAVEDVSVAVGNTGVPSTVARFAAGEELTLVAPNGDLLQPRWLASGGSLESDVGELVTWQAPDSAGDYTLTLIVSDGSIRVGQDIAVAVSGE